MTENKELIAWFDDTYPDMREGECFADLRSTFYPLAEKAWNAALQSRPTHWNEDMSAAPRDGTRVLLGRFGDAIEGAFLWWACMGFWSGKWNNWNDGVEPSGLAEPNVWMPLPQPPEEQE